MFPWSIRSFIQCHVESLPAELARLTGLDYKTAKKLSKGEEISQKKLEQCPFPEEIIRCYQDRDIKVRVCEEWASSFKFWQKVFAQNGAERLRSFANLKTTISSIIWVEEFFLGTLNAHAGDPPKLPQELLSAKSPLAPFPELASNIVQGPYTVEQKMTACVELYEIMTFPLYCAAMDLDFRESGLIKNYPSPRRFLPSMHGKSLRRPVWHFFDWLRETCGCDNWQELQSKIDPKENDHSLEGRLKNWRNSKTRKTLPRRESIQSILNSLARNLKELPPNFCAKGITAYSLSRIMQVHLMQCTAPWRLIRLDQARIAESYAEAFECWEKIGCRDVPLHPMFS